MDISEDRSRAVQDAVYELLSPRNALRDVPELNISKPNYHDSKAEFRRELAAVQTAMESLRVAFLALYPEGRQTDEVTASLARRIEEAIDQGARRKIRIPNPNTITDLVRKNKADTGYFHHALWGFIDLMEFLTDRLDELEDQERQYWSKSHRAPNYYARAIALRLARLYAQEKGGKPTFGTARDGGHPSTAYGRALEKIFVALEIKGGVRHPAKWAIAQLTDKDLEAKQTTNMLAGLMGLGNPPERLGDVLQDEPLGIHRMPTRNALADITKALTKGPED